MFLENWVSKRYIMILIYFIKKRISKVQVFSELMRFLFWIHFASGGRLDHLSLADWQCYRALGGTLQHVLQVRQQKSLPKWPEVVEFDIPRGSFWQARQPQRPLHQAEQSHSRNKRFMFCLWRLKRTLFGISKGDSLIGEMIKLPIWCISLLFSICCCFCATGESLRLQCWWLTMNLPSFWQSDFGHWQSS